jgi:hypothetical protein
MADSLPQLLALAFVLILFCFFLLFFVGFFGYIAYQNWKRNQIRQKTLIANSTLFQGRSYFRARGASERRFNSWFKILPWDSAGLVVSSGKEVIYIGEHVSGGAVYQRFEPAHAKWIGKAPWPNGAVSWIVAETPEGKYYLSSETGFFIVGSNKTTRALFDGIQAGQSQLPGGASERGQNATLTVSAKLGISGINPPS